MRASVAERQDAAQEREQPRLSVRRNAGWNLAGNIAYAGAQWLQLVIIARLGTPEQVGHFAYAAAICTPVFMFSNLQLRSAQASDANGYFEFREYIGVRLLTSTIAVALIAVGTALFAGASPWAWIVIVMAIAKAIESFADVFEGHMQRRQRMDLAGKSMLLKSVLLTGLSLAAQGLTRSVLALTCAIATAHLLTLLFFDVRAAESLGPLTYDFGKPFSRFGRLLGLAWRCLPLGITMSLISLQSSAPRLVLARFGGASAVGVFAAMVYLANIGTTLVSSAGTAAAPRLADFVAAGERRQFHRLLLQVIALAMTVGLAGIAAAYFAGSALLGLVYGGRYAGYGPAFLICMIASAIWLVTSALGFAATAQGRFGAQPVAVAIGLVVMTGALFALVPRFGVQGAALATAISAVVCMFAYLAIVSWFDNDQQRIRS